MILWDYAKKDRSCDIIYYKEIQRDLSTPKHKKRNTLIIRQRQEIRSRKGFILC